jgi:hypothetical protein
LPVPAKGSTVSSLGSVRCSIGTHTPPSPCAHAQALQAEARAQGLLYFSTGVACPQGHLAKRYVSTGQCFQCQRDHAGYDASSPFNKARAAIAEAKAEGRRFYCTGIPCEKGHIAERKVSSQQCVQCLKEWNEAKRQDPAYLARMKANGARNERKPETRHRRRTRQAQREREEVCYLLARRIRHRLYVAIKENGAGSAVRDLGCTIEEFKAHIESMFQPNMSWENWRFDTWHLDHIRPLAMFDLSDREQFLEACHWSNYRPLWAAENLTKWAGPGYRKRSKPRGAGPVAKVVEIRSGVISGL